MSAHEPAGEIHSDIAVNDAYSLPDSGQHNQDDEDSGSGDESRDNRFAGWSVTWRTHTASERNLVASLDRTHANDLSTHLYNTHALKARARADTSQSPAWSPDAAWSAWPLKPGHVPRPDEEFGKPAEGSADDETYRIIESWKPSDDLEAEVQALILRQAKQNLRHTEHSIHFDRQDLGSEPSLELIVDEDHIDDLLQPSVRHIVAQFEDLLGGLRSNRQIWRSDTPARSRTPRSRSRSRSRPNSQRDSLARTSSQMSASGAEASSDDEHHSQAKVLKRPRPLNPRSWIEVLAIAQIVGWDAEIIERAAHRCRSLFGQDPLLEGLLEQQTAETAIVPQDSGEPVVRTVTSTGPKAPVREPRPPRPSINWRICPFEHCPRHKLPFELPFRWREHLKRTHKRTKAQVAEHERQLNPALAVESAQAETGDGLASEDSGAAGDSDEGMLDE